MRMLILVRRFVSCLAAAFSLACMPAMAQAPTATTGTADAAQANGGPVRLRQPLSDAIPTTVNAPVQAQAKAGEFENFVGLSRFGADLVNELAAGASDFSPIVPPEYVVQSGDELQVAIWGSVDAELRLVVDRSGRVSIPRVGPVMVAGIRFADLGEAISRRVGQVFKNFEISVSLGRLRGLRVYVTGFVQRPGAYAVASLSTVMNAVMRAGGPAAAGSFRQIELRRGGRVVGTFDLYDLLMRGDRTGDRLVEPDDVVHVAPVGTQVALRGSINKQAVFELKPGETLSDLIRMAGGFSAVADRSRVAIERIDERNAQRIVQLQLPRDASAALGNGDVVRAYSAVDVALSVVRQNKRVRVEGEVMRPGDYLLPPESTLPDALRAAGGLTTSAFLYGAQFLRESVRITQQENYERALRDLETDLARVASTQRVSSAEDAATQAGRTAATSRLIDRLRTLQPTGRIVLQLPLDGLELPGLTLEDGDRLVVPPKPTTVGIFGSVYNSGNYLHRPSRVLDDYLRLAGGPTRGADDASLFVVRANGQVISSRQSSSWFTRGNQIGNVAAEPGDTVFVPEEIDKSTLVQVTKDLTLILYQFGLGAAGLASFLK